LGYEPKGSKLSPVESIALPRFQLSKELGRLGLCTLVARESRILASAFFVLTPESSQASVS
jgi:hypothetical protein